MNMNTEEKMFIERHDFIFQAFANSNDLINDGLEELNLFEVERDRLIAWQLGVSL